MNNILKKIQMLIRKGLFFIFVGFICITACGCGSGEISLYEDMEAVSSNQSTETGDEDDSETVDSDDSETANLDISSEKVGKIKVYVCGAVRSPGVYELDADARINDALEVAGGFAENADIDIVNLADVAADGQKIYFPVEGEDIQSDIGKNQNGQADAGSDRLININEAGVEELTELPGIGETRAGQIVEYRQTYGRFSDKEDLKNVSGIGDSIYRKLETYITVD